MTHLIIWGSMALLFGLQSVRDRQTGRSGVVIFARGLLAAGAASVAFSRLLPSGEGALLLLGLGCAVAYPVLLFIEWHRVRHAVRP